MYIFYLAHADALLVQLLEGGVSNLSQLDCVLRQLDAVENTCTCIVVDDTWNKNSDCRRDKSDRFEYFVDVIYDIHVGVHNRVFLMSSF